MKMDNAELKEVIDIWNLAPSAKKRINRILDENPVLSAPHLFRYYNPVPKAGKVERLEREFAKMSGAKHALAVNSGTSALIAALVACGVGPGDEVIVPGYTFFASCSAVVVAKAIPVICEVDETLTMDPADFERKITRHTKAVIPVHMRGLPCDMKRIMAVAKKHKVKVIEDVAQAGGGTFRGTWLGRFGDVGCFSFDFYKLIASGEGGMVVSDDERTFIRAQSWHDTAACWRPNRFARERMRGELFCGENYRLSEVHGAIALAQMRKLKAHLAACRKAKKALAKKLAALKVLKLGPVTDPEGDCATNLILLAPDTATAKKTYALAKEMKVPLGGIYDQTVRDWHIYRYWEHILEKKTVTEEGCPFTCPHYKGKLPDYSPDMCPKTLDILGRTLIVGTEGKTLEQIRAVAAGVRALDGRL